MALTILFGVISSLAARAQVTQRQIDNLRDQQRAVQQQRREAQAHINSINFERLGAVAQKSVLDDRIMLTQQEIDLINETIDTLVELIAEKRAEVFAAESRENAQLQRFRRRVRDMEENGVITYLDIIFSSTNFSDLLARIDFVRDIMRADETLYNNLTAARVETQEAQARLEKTMHEAEEERVQLELREAELEVQLEEANELIRQIEADLEAANELYEQRLAEEREVQAEINRMVEQQRREEEARRAAEAAARAAGRNVEGGGGPVQGTGTLVWPVPERNVVSSPFGTRMHPVHRVNRFHAGIDIPAPTGTNVIAADGGRVIVSQHSPSYGHYIVINHGNGRTTLYAHLSSRAVSVGQLVTQGQVIGRVGSTGISTGPHLHFEVSQNGTRVNPLNFFSGWTRRGW